MLLVTTPIAADPAGAASPAVLSITATPAQLGLLDTVTIATKLYNGGPIAGPYVTGALAGIRRSRFIAPSPLHDLPGSCPRPDVQPRPA